MLIEQRLLTKKMLNNKIDKNQSKIASLTNLKNWITLRNQIRFTNQQNRMIKKFIILIGVHTVEMLLKYSKAIKMKFEISIWLLLLKKLS